MPTVTRESIVSETDELRIALTVDSDSDQFDPSVCQGSGSMLPSWDGVEYGISAIIEATASCHDSYGFPPRFTWFVRIDPQLEALYGDCGYLLDRFASLWKFCQQRGDELAWHPHLYCREGERWIQETDPKNLRAQLQQTWASLKKRGFSGTSSRIGDAFGSNEIMQTLSGLGLRCDATAMPGRVRRDAHRHLDWDGTPTHPYRPSVADYRRPGTPALDLLEIPMSMVAVKAEYDATPLSRYIDLSFRHDALRGGLKSFLPDAKTIVTVTHPSSVLASANGARHGLISHDLGEFRHNLDWILEECGRLGRPSRFVTISEIERYFFEG
jgi:hypothetical protein